MRQFELSIRLVKVCDDIINTKCDPIMLSIRQAKKETCENYIPCYAHQTKRLLWCIDHNVIVELIVNPSDCTLAMKMDAQS